MFSTRIVELDQWNTGSALNSRGPQLWRKTRPRERVSCLSHGAQCGGRWVRTRICLGSTRVYARGESRTRRRWRRERNWDPTFSTLKDPHKYRLSQKILWDWRTIRPPNLSPVTMSTIPCKPHWPNTFSANRARSFSSHQISDQPTNPSINPGN